MIENSVLLMSLVDSGTKDSKIGQSFTQYCQKLIKLLFRSLLILTLCSNLTSAPNKGRCSQLSTQSSFPKCTTKMTTPNRDIRYQFHIQNQQVDFFHWFGFLKCHFHSNTQPTGDSCKNTQKYIQENKIERLGFKYVMLHN